MTIKDFLNKNYEYVSYRLTIKEWSDEYLSHRDEIYEHSTFAGCFEIKDGKIITLDGDSYYENEEVVWYEEWNSEEVKNGLTIIVRTDCALKNNYLAEMHSFC